MTDQPASTTPSYVDTYQPPVQSPTGAVSQPAPAASSIQSAADTPAATGSTNMPSSDQSLESQNIFTLLGISSATDQEKEEFLDQLQQVIWEDFLENDVELLITEAERTQLQELMKTKQGDELAQQEAIMSFLEKLIPDLEEIMMEKALELKADMVKERIAGMREFYADKPAQLAEIDKAEAQLRDDQWQSVAKTLNAVQ